MFKWLNKIRLKGLPSKTENNVLVVDDNGDIGINTGVSTGVSLESDEGTISDSSGTASFTIAGGNALGTVATGSTLTVHHSDTSSQASVDNSGRAFVQDITLDTYGHVTGITSATDSDTHSGTVTSVSVSDGSSSTAITGSGTFTFSAGEGIDVGESSGTVTVTAETATDTNLGVATFSDTDFEVSEGDVTLVDLTSAHIASGTLVTESDGIASNDNDTTLPTSAAVKDHVDAKYSYQYITFLADSDAIVDNQYIVPGTNGISNHSWNKDSDLDYTGDNATTVGHADAHITMDYLIGIASIPIPHTCDLCGFYAVGRNETTNGNNFGIGMFVSEVADVDWGGTGNWNAKLRAFSLSEGTGNEKRIQRIDGILGTPFTVHEGDIITPAVVAPTDDQVKATITLVLRTKLTT